MSSVGGVVEPSPGGTRPRELPGRLIPLRPLTIPDVLDLAFQTLRWLGAPLAILVLAVLLPEQLLREVIGVRLLAPQALDPTDVGAAFANLGWVFVSSFVGFYVGLVISAAIVALLGARDRGEALAVRPALRIGLVRSGATLGASLMVGIGTVVLLVPAILVGMLFALTLPIVGFLLLVPIVLFVPLVGYLCSFLLVAVAVEEWVGPWRTLTRTLALVRAGFWRAVLITLLLWLLMLGVVAGLFVGGVLLSTVLGDGAWILQVLGGGLFAAVSTPLSAAAGLVLYRDLRVRGEAFDLVSRSRALRRVPA